MANEPPKQPTFGSKLREMQRDLASIVDRMNRDRSFDAAKAAQDALVAVSRLEGELFNEDLPWDWQPDPGLLA